MKFDFYKIYRNPEPLFCWMISRRKPDFYWLFACTKKGGWYNRRALKVKAKVFQGRYKWPEELNFKGLFLVHLGKRK